MGVELHLGDCHEFMKTLPDGAVDHVITDPPYSEQTHANARSMKDLGAKLVTFDSMSVAEFLYLARECVRVARRWVIMTCDWRHASQLEAAGLPLARLGVWVKPNSAPQFSGDKPGPGWEAVAILHRRGGGRHWNGGGKRGVWTCNIAHNQLHPTQKPLALVKEWLNDFTDPGETVFDPFMGSGTTGVACVQTGRNFIGCEIDEGYFRIAQKRIGDAAMQPALFTAPEPQAQQLEAYE